MALFPSAHGFLNGFFFATTPLPLLFAYLNIGFAGLSTNLWLWIPTLLAPLLHLKAAFARKPGALVRSGSAATLATTGLALVSWWLSPFGLLFTGLTASSVLFLLLEQLEKRQDTGITSWQESRLRGALSVSTIAGLVLLLGIKNTIGAWILSLCCALGFLEIGMWVWRRRNHPRRSHLDRSLTYLTITGVVVTLGLMSEWPASLGVLGIASALALLWIPAAQRNSTSLVGSWWAIIVDQPARLLLATFFALCTLGTLLLLLTWSTPVDQGISIMDAAFTAVSAVCVTGLTVVDTAHSFTPFGQFIIMLLIQFGGLGIMTFSTTTLHLLGRRMSLRHESVGAGMLGSQDRRSLFASARNILIVTLAVETTGTLLLSLGFLFAGEAPLTSLWHGIFTAISAFCNAGFALNSQNLVPFQTSPLILHTTALLIIFGGISPVLAAATPLLGEHQRRPRLLSLQSKLILVTTAVLLVTGFFTYLMFEWNGALAPLGIADRFHNAWFQSVTTRTAGFNSIALTHLQPTTITLTIALMFIGGGPGSTAGGIKTSTLAVLFLAVWAAIQGRADIETYGRRIPRSTVNRAVAIAVVGLLVVSVFFLLIIQTQDMSVRAALFEVVSALGTVGLTIGGTERLDEVGKGLIITCMFLGRTGPLTLFLFLGTRKFRSSWKLIEEDVEVG